MRNVALTLSVAVCLLMPANLASGQTNAARNEKDPSPASRAQDDSLTLRMTDQTAVRTPRLSVSGRTFGSEQAIVPRLIKFNGTLRDLSGKPLSGPVDVTFSLYAEESGGAPLWFETQTVQASSLGHYTALLGAMTPAGVLMELFASGEAHWLGVQVANLPEPPRVLLVSVPYALKAGDAETLGGKPASAFMLATQAGTNATTAAAAGTLSALVQANALTNGGGTTLPSLVMTANYIPVFTDALGNHGNSAMYQSGSYVGVGTLTPAFPFDVNNNVFGIGPQASSPGMGGTMRLRDDSGTVRWLFGIPGTVGSQDFFMYNLVNGHAPIYIENAAPSYSFYFKANGNVGIGTASPTQRLDVAGNINASGNVGAAGIFTGNGSGLTTLNAGNLSTGTLPSARLAGTYSGAVTFNNASNVFTGNGAGLTNVVASNSDMLDGLHAANFATVAANSFTGDQTIAGNLILNGTVNGWQIVPYKSSSCTIFGSLSTCISANVLGGYTTGSKSSALAGARSLSALVTGGNTITDGVVGGTISGGGGTVNGTNYGSKVDNNWATIGGGATNSAGDGNGATSGACCQTISGGYGNWASGDRATIAGGGPNIAGGTLATIGGGMWNNASFVATIAGGDHNTASATYTFVGGGQGNTASGQYDAVAGGYYNTAGTGSMAAVGGGMSNTASGQGATIPGGDHNVASGTYSFAAGCHANAVHEGAFVWSASHSQCSTVSSSVNGQFVANAPGGFWLGNTLSDPVTATQNATHFLETTTGAYLTTSGAWTNNSDRNLKTAFEPVDHTNLLALIGQLPITRWQYKIDGPNVRHIGPMAQDFYAAFKLGNDDKHISTIDEGGVALAGVQALYRLGLQKDEEIRALKAVNQDLARQIEELRKSQQAMAATLARLAGKN